MTLILVTGANGQLGQCFKYLESKFKDLNFVFKSSNKLDITKKADVKSVFSKNKNINYVINCAAYTNVDKAEAESEKAYNINVLGVKNLCFACNENNAVLIHFSTDFVFDGNKQEPYLENDTPNPINVYGQTKLEGEKVIERLLKQYFIFRTSWLYSQFGNNFLKTMLRLSEIKDEISVVSDQLGTPTYAVDLANAVLKLVQTKMDNFGMYHFSNSGSCSWHGFAAEIFSLKSVNIRLIEIESSDYNAKAERPKYSVLDTTKLQQTLNNKLNHWKYSLKEAINATID